MSVEDLSICFEYDANKQYYKPGEYIRGTITLYLRTALRVRSIIIYFTGRGNVSWESDVKKKVYKAEETYLDGSKVLLDAGYEKPVSLRPGAHRFSFYYQTPTDLPSTFNGVYGKVVYLAKAIVESEFEGDTTVSSEPFLVLRRPELPAEAYEETELKKSRFFLGCCTTGKVKVHATLNNVAATPGDNLVVNAEVANWSGRGISLIQAAVIQESHYFARGHELVFRQILNKRMDEYEFNFLRGRRWKNVKLQVPPYIADSGLENCKIMDVRYLFEFKVQIQNRDDISVETELLVGGAPPDLLLKGPVDPEVRRRFTSLSMETSARDYPWYGGRSITLSESVNGTSFDPM